MEYIDMRSDTVTQPTDDMREAMMNAAVGDDVYGDDPTVLKLEQMAADLLGKKQPCSFPAEPLAINWHCLLTVPGAVKLY